MIFVFDNWLWFAIPLSCFWGVYGCKFESQVKPHKYKYLIDFIKENRLEAFGVFTSEFIGSFAGWYCLHLLAPSLNNYNKDSELGGFDIFLGTVAVIGITGYSHKLFDKIGK